MSSPRVPDGAATTREIVSPMRVLGFRTHPPASPTPPAPALAPVDAGAGVVADALRTASPPALYAPPRIVDAPNDDGAGANEAALPTAKTPPAPADAVAAPNFGAKGLGAAPSGLPSFASTMEPAGTFPPGGEPAGLGHALLLPKGAAESDAGGDAPAAPAAPGAATAALAPADLASAPLSAPAPAPGCRRVEGFTGDLRPPRTEMRRPLARLRTDRTEPEPPLVTLLAGDPTGERPRSSAPPATCAAARRAPAAGGDAAGAPLAPSSRPRGGAAIGTARELWAGPATVAPGVLLVSRRDARRFSTSSAAPPQPPCQEARGLCLHNVPRSVAAASPLQSTSV